MATLEPIAPQARPTLQAGATPRPEWDDEDDNGVGFWPTQPPFAAELQPWQRCDPAVTLGSLGSSRREPGLAAQQWLRLGCWLAVALTLVALCWLAVWVLSGDAAAGDRPVLWAMAAPLLRLELLQSSGALQGWRPATWWERLWAWLVGDLTGAGDLDGEL